MKFFDMYTSNTLAGSSAQNIFKSDGNTRIGRAFYKIFASGEYEYAFLFNNILDSTYEDGSFGHVNLLCDEWLIERIRVAECDTIDNHIDDDDFQTITFDGCVEKKVCPGEVFYSDAVRLNLTGGKFLCYEITYHGEILPWHPEICVSAFTKKDDAWIRDWMLPVPSMIGCNRNVKKRIAYFGDSITQGCGTPHDAYSNWSAILSEQLGKEYSYWNLGIGYARGADAATDGVWLFKAKQNDIVIVCFGVNDILHENLEIDVLKKNLNTIVNHLKEAGATVIVQTVPPFDFQDDRKEKWLAMNEYIRTELVQYVDMVFDNGSFLAECKEHPERAKYGGHPNEEGCAVWAEELYKALMGSTAYEHFKN